MKHIASLFNLDEFHIWLSQLVMDGDMFDINLLHSLARNIAHRSDAHVLEYLESFRFSEEWLDSPTHYTTLPHIYPEVVNNVLTLADRGGLDAVLTALREIAKGILAGSLP